MAEVQKFTLTWHLNATVDIDGKAWVKPGVSAGIHFDGVPDPDQIQAASEMAVQHVLEPTLDDVLAQVVKRIDAVSMKDRP